MRFSFIKMMFLRGVTLHHQVKKLKSFKNINIKNNSNFIMSIYWI